MSLVNVPQKLTNMSEAARNEFSMAVEKKAVEMKIPYKTALTLVMVECAIEPNVIAKMINRTLKEKIEAECLLDRTIKGSKEKGADIFKEFS